MKSSGAGFSVIDRREIEEKIKAIKNDVDGDDLPNVYLLHGDLTDDEMNELYNHPKVKAHVSFTHGEGFGRPLLEASLSEKPILVSGWSGHVDFLQPSLAIHLPGGMTKVHKSSFPKGIFVGDSYWFSVNYQAASKVIEEVYNNYKKHTLNAKKLSMVNKSTFSLKAMTEKFEKILNQYLPEFSVEVPLNLPKLKKKDASMPVQASTLPQLKKKSTDSKPTGISLPKLKKVN
jgi:glycosyltransferase involved in cell wall biosynthesis